MKALELELDDPQPYATSLPDSPSSLTVTFPPSPTLYIASFSSTSTTTTATLAPSTTSSTPLSSSTAACTACPTDSRTCPPCKTGYICRLSVIDSSCQCPVASCVKPGFDTGADSSNGSVGSGSTPSGSSDSRSILVPVLGGVAGLIIIIVIAFLIARQRRQRKKVANGDRLLDQEGQIDEAADPFNNSDKKSSHNGESWPGALNIANGQKDVIRIAYVPSIATTTAEVFQIPELVHLGGGPRVSFIDDEYDKHISVASSLSTGILDEAIVMTMNKKATPKVFRLNTIKASNSDMIQRSNSLHSSNSIKRTQSQRKAATMSRRQTSESGAVQKEEVLEDAFTETQQQHSASNDDVPDEAEEEDQQQFTPAVMITGPSARSSAQSTASMNRKPKPPNMVLEPRPLHPSYHVNTASTSPPSKSPQLLNNSVTSNSNSFTNASTATSSMVMEPTALVSLLVSTSSTVNAPPVVASTAHSFSRKDKKRDPRLSTEILRSEENEDTEWVSPNPKTPESNTNRSKPKSDANNSPSSAPPATRNSTFSTQSDARSTTTRGDGEEIMIFWDGHRDSRVSNTSNASNVSIASNASIASKR